MKMALFNEYEDPRIEEKERLLVLRTEGLVVRIIPLKWIFREIKVTKPEQA